MLPAQSYQAPAQGTPMRLTDYELVNESKRLCWEGFEEKPS